MSEGLKFPQYLTSLVCCIGALMVGLSLGWSSPVENEVKSGAFGFKVTDEQFAWVGSSLPFGAFFSCIPAGFLINEIGRKVMLCVLPCIFLLGWFNIQFAVNPWMLYFGRFIVGIACGAVCAVTPVYIGEIAQKEIRGSCGSYFQLCITIGATLAYLFGAFVRVKPLNYICMTICIAQFVGMLLMPESPTYLIEKEKEEEATKALEFLRGKNYDSKLELEETKADIIALRIAKAEKSFFASFNNLACYRALYIALGLMFFQQMTGINAVLFYSTSIFQQVGSNMEPRFTALLFVAIGPVMTFIFGFVVDRFGRRLLLILSSAFMTGSTIVFGFYFYFREKNEESVEGIGWIPIIALCIFAIMFSFGYGPVPWIMIGELFAADVRGPAGSVAATSNWMFAFIVAKLYLSVKNAIGVGITFWIFSILSFLGIFFVVFFVPETKGKSLQEIQEILSRTNSKS